MQLAFQQVGFSYKGAQHDAPPALHNISFELQEGECLAIAGHTGSGKSTLAQHFNGLLQATEGRVLWCGEDMANPEVAANARRNIGLVFQYPERQLFAQTVLEDVMFGPRNIGLSERAAKRAATEALAQVGLNPEELGGASPFRLSGGQQRRVALAGVLAMQPEVLVLDEPAAGLDPATHIAFMQLIGQLHAAGTTCVVVSHNMDDIARLATRILVLNEGSIALLGTPEEVFSQVEELQQMGLDVPQAQALAYELRAAGLPLPEQLYNEQSLIEKIFSTLQ